MYPKTELIAFSDSNLISYDISDSNLISHDKEKVAESPRSLDPQTVVHATTTDSTHSQGSLDSFADNIGLKSMSNAYIFANDCIQLHCDPK